ncbi:MAG: YccF domain-containing protein [Desulfovibrionaceae bacterium]
MKTLGNIIWFLLYGGLFSGLLWWLFGLFALISIVGIPWARACFVVGSFTFFPFGKEAIARDQLRGIQDIGTSIFGTLGNIIWFIFAGVWIALCHVLEAAVSAVTIIGIPFAWQHLKLAALALCPIGMTVVDSDVAQLARQENARETLQRVRRP